VSAPVATPASRATTPFPTNPPIWDPVNATQQIQNVRQAIQNAELIFDLSTYDGSQLTVLLDTVAESTARRDREAAAEACHRLANAVEALAIAGKLTNGQELRHAVESLLNALGETI
jgi:hypothetical protein